MFVSFREISILDDAPCSPFFADEKKRLESIKKSATAGAQTHNMTFF